MSELPYPAPPACTEPSLGARATQALGTTPPAPIAAHLLVCGACRLQRFAFAGADAPAIPLPPALAAGLRQIAMARFPG